MQLLAGRRAQRHAEPHVAAARDLAEAYHYLDSYGRVYDRPDFLGNDQTVSGSWRDDAFVTQLAHQVLDLDRDPTQLQSNSDYMRAGIAADDRPPEHDDLPSFSPVLHRLRGSWKLRSRGDAESRQGRRAQLPATAFLERRAVRSCVHMAYDELLALPAIAHRLADGTEYFGRLGQVAYDEAEDKVQCHLCGGWFRAFGGSHLRRTKRALSRWMRAWACGSSGLPAMADDRVWRDWGAFLSLIAGWRALVR